MGNLSGLLRGTLLVIGLAGLWWGFEAGKRLIGPTETIRGPVTHVRDGDTIEVSKRAIRLSGLTCDERGTRLGERASGVMRELVMWQTLTCEVTSERSYDRSVGQCRLPDGRDLGAMLIARGVCGRCDRYDPLRKYAEVQDQAGSFAGADPSYCWAPW